MKIALALGIFIMFALTGIGSVHAQTTTGSYNSSTNNSSGTNINGTDTNPGTVTPGIPNTAANPISNSLIMVISALIMSGGAAYITIKGRA